MPLLPFNWECTRNLKTERSDHTATLLPDGRVLVASGEHIPGILRSAELYDAGAARWNRTGKLYNPRYDHTATLLSNGTVLVAGGFGDSDVLASAEVYDLGIVSAPHVDVRGTNRQQLEE